MVVGEVHAHRVLEKGCAHLLLEGLLEVFSDAICLKDQSFLWTVGHLDLAEVGDRKAIGKRARNWLRKINRSCGVRATWTWLRWGTGGL